MVKWLKHAFAVEPPGPAVPDEPERELVERLARAIVRRGLSQPALLFLECSHNLNFIGSQFLLFVAPLAELIFPREQYRVLARFLDRRGSVEYICRRVEAVCAERQAAAKTGRATQNVE